jgi:lipopolysaccharide transport system ATP-binding protein
MGGRGIFNFYKEPVKLGKIYGTVYLNHNQFQKTVFDPFSQNKSADYFSWRRAIFNWWNFRVNHNPYRSFVVIRDLRDTLVSLYYSARYSHKIIADEMIPLRQKLNNLSEEGGLIHMLNVILPASASIQTSWLHVKSVPMFRYEDIIGNEYDLFGKLIDHCQISVDRDLLHDIVSYNLFENAAGRKRGHEDVNAHLRKGVAGDWRNHFTDRLKEEFKKRFGDVLIKTGYEKDLSW